MAVSSVSAYSGSSYYSGNGMDAEYEQIKKEMISLGLTPSGNKEADKAKLKEAEEKQAKQEEKRNSPQPPPELQSILNQLGISASGDLETDISNATDAIKNKIQNATSDTEKAKFENLQQQLDQFQEMQSASMGASNMMMGASALANLNRKMLMG